MDFEKLAAERYSLRKFSDQPVEEETLARILEAGRNAPTAHNNQPQRILVLRSKEALALADGCARSHFDSPVMLVVSYDPADAWIREEDGKNHGEIDAAIATTQMMLQAADLGLGTTYIGMFDPEKLRAAFPEELAWCRSPCWPWVILPRTQDLPVSIPIASRWRKWSAIAESGNSGGKEQPASAVGRMAGSFLSISAKKESQNLSDSQNGRRNAFLPVVFLCNFHVIV